MSYECAMWAHERSAEVAPTPIEYRVFLAVCFRASADTGIAVVSVGQLVEETALLHRWVTAALAELCDLGLLERLERGHYQVRMPLRE
jgi:predicted transcriptional regulator of viral defense system